jgi:hypothetical protein
MVDPRMIIFAETSEGEPVGCAICLPDANEAMARVRSGRLLPFGWYRLLRGMKSPTKVRVWALGVKPQFQSRAVGPLLYQRLLDNLWGMDNLVLAEASWILESNDLMNGPIESMGGARYKTWRLYQRPA